MLFNRKQHQSRHACITLACAHLKGDFNIVKQKEASAKALANGIDQQKHASALRHWSCTFASSVSCTYPLADVGCGPVASVVAFSHHSVLLDLDFPTSPFAWTQWPVSVKRGAAHFGGSLCIYQPTLVVDSPYRPWLLPIVELSSSVDWPHHSWPKNTINDNRRGLYTSPLACISVNQRWVWPFCITFCLHKKDNWCHICPAIIAFGLHTLVSRHHTWTARITICMQKTIGQCRTWD